MRGLRRRYEEDGRRPHDSALVEGDRPLPDARGLGEGGGMVGKYGGGLPLLSSYPTQKNPNGLLLGGSSNFFNRDIGRLYAVCPHAYSNAAPERITTNNCNINI